MRKTTLALALALTVVAAGLVAGQNSPGGAFVPTASYILSGQWTFRGQASPLKFKGTQDTYTTTLTVTNPTANRTLTLPNATDTLVGKATTDTLTNKTLTSATLSSPSLTTPTMTSPTVSSGSTTIAATTNQVVLGTTNTTTISATAPASSITLTLPNGGSAAIPVHYECGSTGTGSQTCSPTAAAATSKVFSGRSTLASNAATITFAPAFTSSSTFNCVANDITTRANPVQMVPASASTATITNTTGGSDVIQWLCAGQ